MEHAKQETPPSASTTIPSQSRVWQPEQRPMEREADKCLRSGLTIFTRYLLLSHLPEKGTCSGLESRVLVGGIRSILSTSSLRPPQLKSCNRLATSELWGRQGLVPVCWRSATATTVGLNLAADTPNGLTRTVPESPGEPRRRAPSTPVSKSPAVEAGVPALSRDGSPAHWDAADAEKRSALRQDGVSLGRGACPAGLSLVPMGRRPCWLGAVEGMRCCHQFRRSGLQRIAQWGESPDLERPRPRAIMVLARPRV